MSSYGDSPQNTNRTSEIVFELRWKRYLDCGKWTGNKTASILVVSTDNKKIDEVTNFTVVS